MTAKKRKHPRVGGRSLLAYKVNYLTRVMKLEILLLAVDQEGLSFLMHAWQKRWYASIWKSKVRTFFNNHKIIYF